MITRSQSSRAAIRPSMSRATLTTAFSVSGSAESAASATRASTATPFAAAFRIVASTACGSRSTA